MPGISRLFLIGLLWTAPPPASGQVRVEESRPAMGTLFRIVACAPDTTTGREAVDAAFERIDALEAVLSDYDPDSEVSRLGRTYQPGVPARVSADLALALDRSATWWSRTDGAFDAAQGSLTRRWRRAIRRGSAPDAEALSDARAAAGWRHVAWNRGAAEVVFDVAGVRLDFGGIGKGLAADEALATLAASGLPAAIVDAGGDVVAGAAPPGRKGWIVSLPDEWGGGRVYLADSAIATSGDRYRHVDVDGVRYAHIVDPATGIGTTGGRTVTVVARSGAAADALATAFSVTGVDPLAHLVPDDAGAVLVAGDTGVRSALGRPLATVPPAAGPADCRESSNFQD